jgi:nucleoid-associated protein YgaU
LGNPTSALTSRVEALQGDLRTARSYEETVAELMTANQALLASQGILEFRIADSDAAYQNAMSRADALEARLAQLDVLPDQLDEVKGALVTLQGDYDAVSREKDQLALQVAEAQASAVQQQIQAEETWTQERTRLRMEIEQLRNTADEISSRSSSDQAQLASLLEEVTTARSRVTTLEQQLDSAGEQTSEMAAITARLQSAEEELGRQRTANSQLQGALTTERRSHESRLSSLERENDALSTRLRRAQNTLDQIAAAARVLNPGSGGVATATPRVRSPSTSNTRPATASRPAAARTHVVVEGDSLTRISMLYYGTPTRWQDIYQANRETLSEANALRPGQQLRIP